MNATGKSSSSKDAGMRMGRTSVAGEEINQQSQPRGTMWYDPVFKVGTLAGQDVWRRRHYRVRRGATDSPGTFYFSVLDNGVVSKEFWRILDVADDCSWVVLYYSGAAAAAGTNYRGALVCSKDGRWPEHLLRRDNARGVRELSRIEAALRQGGIELWELYQVDNEDCGADCRAGAAPLGVPVPFTPT